MDKIDPFAELDRLTQEQRERDYRTLIRDHVQDVRGRERAQMIRDEDHTTFDKQKENFDALSFLKDTSKPLTLMGRHPRPIRFYTALGDPSLSVYINDAKEKARGNYNIGMRHWFKEYVLGVAFISIKLFGRLCLIRIMPADSFEFEFASSANPVVTWTAAQEGMSFIGYRGVHVGVHVGLVQGAMVTSPVIRTQKRSVAGSGDDTSINKRPYQVELINEPVTYTTPQDIVSRKRYPYELYDSWAPHAPQTGVFTRCHGWGLGAGWTGFRTPMFQHILRDIGFDIPYMDSQNLDAVRLAYIRDNTDWPRANGKQVVKDAKFGERTFAIYVDAFNQFSIFPVAAIDPLNVVNPYLQNVPSFYVTMATPVLPAWCYKQIGKASDISSAARNSGDWITDYPEPDWKFDHEGKRAVSIFYERFAFIRDNALFDSADGTSASDPFTTADFNEFNNQTGIQGRHGVVFNSGHNEQRYAVAPGIIETTINIELTGFELNEYVATLTTREVRRPTTATHCSLYVGYVWYDVPFGAKVVKDKKGNITKDERIAKVGDFVTYDLEWYYRLGSDTEQVLVALLHSIKRIDTSETGGITFTEVMTPPNGPLVAVDLTSLSFVQQVINDKRTTRVAVKKTGDPYGGTRTIDWTTPHFGMSVVVGAKYREVLFPEALPQVEKTNFKNLLTAYFADPLTNRKELDKLMRNQLGWVYMPLNDPTDWATGNYNQWRLSQLTTLHHLLGPHAPPPDANAISKYCIQATYSYLPPIHCYYTPTFKFAWYTYADLIQNFHVQNGDTTFFAHPTGSWAFWCNTYTYLIDGMPYVADYVNTLDSFTPDKTIEHCIFDRVHFELRTRNMLLGKHDTTFLELYNRAVVAGQKANTLAKDILPIALVDMRATFEKNIFTYPTPPYTDVTYLDLKITWDGDNYWYPETGIQGGVYHALGAPWPQQGGLQGLTMNHSWFTGAGYSGSVLFPALSTKHVRFSNAIILQTKL